MSTRTSSPGARGSRPPAVVSRTRAPAPKWLGAALLAGVLVAGFAVYRGALDYFFSSDDFGWLAHARGLLPPLDNPSRVIPYRLFWSAWSNLFGLAPRPYHVASLAAHLGAAGLLLFWLRSRVGWAASAVGAILLAAHPAAYTAVYWISAIGDPLAVAFALLALTLLERSDARRWLAIPAFAVALLCKESVAALPLVAFFAGRREHGAARSHLADPVRWALVALTGALAIAYVGFDVSGLRSGGSAPYALGAGGEIARNLLTYSGWTLNFLAPTVTSFSDAVDPSVFGWGVALIAVGLAGLAVPALRARGWAAGVAFFVAGLLPVLPLTRHTYHYYLLPALPGAALCLAAALDGAAERLGPRLGAIAAATLALLLVGNGAFLVRKIETYPFTIEGLRSDPVVDRARIAANVIEGLRASGLPPETRLVLWSPTARALENLDDASRWSYGERNVRAALYEGNGVRVFFPKLREVRFTTTFEPASDSVWYALYRVDGSLRAAPAPVIERAIARTAADSTR